MDRREFLKATLAATAVGYVPVINPAPFDGVLKAKKFTAKLYLPDELLEDSAMRYVRGCMLTHMSIQLDDKILGSPLRG
jgi:hypothetical protein